MPRIIDFETHIQATQYVDIIAGYKGYPRYGNDEKGRFTWYVSPRVYETRDGLRDKLENAKTRLADMEKALVDTQVIASSNPGCEVFPKEMGLKLMKINNDTIAEFSNKYPGKFIGLASLPLQDVDASLEEFDRVVSLGMKGLIIFSNANGKYTDRDEFWPIYERAEKQRFPIFLHPTVPANAESFTEYHIWGPVFGFGADTVIAALRLIMSGLVEKYSNLKIVLGHLGETIPFLINRINFVYMRTPEAVPGIKKKPSEYFLSNFYVDTSGVHHQPSLNMVYETMPKDRILFGSDYPFENMSRGVDFVKNSKLPEEDKERIFSRNAAALFGL
ncbi:MAG: amidohydrolase family protein [Nitrososphaerales archaeon]